MKNSNAYIIDGSFVSVTTWLNFDKLPKARSTLLGYEMSWEGQNQGVALEDGVKIHLTLLNAKGDRTVTFPNYLWSKG